MERARERARRQILCRWVQKIVAVSLHAPAVRYS